MSSWPTVAPSDVEARWRPLSAAEQAIATTRLADVEAELRRELRLYGVYGSPADLPPDEIAEWEQRYTSVVADVVRNSLINPEGWLEEREELDDFARTRRRDSAVSAGVGHLTEDAIEKLLPRPRRRRGAFSIHLSRS